MSGHNKWAQIKHKKAITDKKKGQVFSKISREITIAARGNPDIKSNYRLKGVVDKARAINMPQENIERAIKRVSEKDTVELIELQIEAIGPGNVALIVTAITDSRNRTMNELRILLAKLNVRLGQEGSLSWMFKKVGALYYPKSAANLEALELAAIESGAEDVQEQPDTIIIYTRPEDLGRVQKELENIAPAEESGLELRPTSLVHLSPQDKERLDHIIEALDDNDDVQDIFTNHIV